MGSATDAERFLRDLLAVGRVPAVDALEAATRQGIALRTLRRAKAALRVASTHDGPPGAPGPWYWSLPARRVSRRRTDAPQNATPETATVAISDEQLRVRASPVDRAMKNLDDAIARHRAAATALARAVDELQRRRLPVPP